MSSCIYFGWNYIGFIWKQKHIVVREAELFENWRNRSIRRLHVYISCNHRVTIRFCYDVCKSRVSYTIFSVHFAPNLLQRYYLRLYTIIYDYLRLSTTNATGTAISINSNTTPLFTNFVALAAACANMASL